MNLQELKAIQAPLKEAYRAQPDTAIIRMLAIADAKVGDQQCVVRSHTGTITAGLHRAAGGSGNEACSVEILLEALAACAGVTLGAVATNMELRIQSCQIQASAVMDFRGTLGVDRSAQVGLTSIELLFIIESPEPTESIEKLVSLTERYCVIYQTLQASTPVQTVVQYR
ncbi:OsmC family protein [Pirellulaceae bacterium SH467]